MTPKHVIVAAATRLNLLDSRQAVVAEEWLTRHPQGNDPAFGVALLVAHRLLTESQAQQLLARVVGAADANASTRDGTIPTHARQTAGASSSLDAADAVHVAPGMAVYDETPAWIGRFRVLGLLGHGGMGWVYRAFDDKAQRLVALKVMQTPDPDAATIERFRHEATLTAQLEHPGIVPVHDIDTDEHGHPFFVMRIIQGLTVSEKLRGAAPFPLRDRLQVFVKICEAVQFAHDHGIVHRDLKPSNVMVSDFGEVQVLDWGLAKRLRTAPPADSAGITCAERPLAHQDDSRRTQVGAVLGTVHYMAPEQARGEIERVGVLSDVYSLGAVLYELATRTPPFMGPAPLIVRDVIAGRFEPPSQRGLKARPWQVVPLALERVILRAMAVDPARRYPQVRQMQTDVARIAESGALAVVDDELARLLVPFITGGPAIDSTATPDPAGWPDCLARGCQWLMDGHWQAALGDFDRVVTGAPVLSVGWLLRGVALGKLGRHADADQSFQQALTHAATPHVETVLAVRQRLLGA